MRRLVHHLSAIFLPVSVVPIFRCCFVIHQAIISRTPDLLNPDSGPTKFQDPTLLAGLLCHCPICAYAYPNPTHTSITLQPRHLCHSGTSALVQTYLRRSVIQLKVSRVKFFYYQEALLFFPQFLCIDHLTIIFFDNFYSLPYAGDKKLSIKNVLSQDLRNKYLLRLLYIRYVEYCLTNKPKSCTLAHLQLRDPFN